MSGIVTSTASPRGNFLEDLRERKGLVIAVVVISVIAFAAGAYLVTSRSSDPVQSPSIDMAASQVTGAESSPVAPVISGANTSDAQLDTDLQMMNNQIGGLDSNINETSSSLNDQQTDLSSN